MSDKKALITIAVLDAALVSLISGAKGTTFEAEVTKFGNLFATFREQPIVPAYKDLTVDLEQAKTVITELKEKLKEAQDLKASKSDKPVIKVGNINYIVNHGSFPHTVQDIVDNPELAKEILKITGQNAISKL